MALKEKKEKKVKEQPQGTASREFMVEAYKTDGKKQRRPLFKRKRSGEVLTREQVKAIKRGRKVLRKELKAQGIKSKKEFELTASGLGLYFDKSRFLGLLRWFFHGKGLLALLGLILLLLALLFVYATVTQLRGHFTINMSDGMFREGFVLSETADFANPVTNLFCTPAEEIPCISINHLPVDLDDHEGQHNVEYFAYTFFLRNEGESTVGYNWTVNLNSESQNLSDATWVMIFEDGEMLFYAEPGEDGGPQALPAFDDNSRGYLYPPLLEQCKDPEAQYQVVAQRGNRTYYRMVPKTFVTESTVAEGVQQGVAPMDVHKYTVVIWLEGDDPECTNDLIGGHVGMDMQFRLVTEKSDEGSGGGRWEKLWDNLKFWEG